MKYIKKKIFKWLCKDSFDDLINEIKKIEKKLTNIVSLNERRLKETNSRISSILSEIHPIINRRCSEVGKECEEKIDQRISLIKGELYDTKNLYKIGTETITFKIRELNSMKNELLFLTKSISDKKEKEDIEKWEAKQLEKQQEDK